MARIAVSCWGRLSYPQRYPQLPPACNGTLRPVTDEKKPGSLEFLGFPGLYRNIPELLLVEPGGIEPPSASPLQEVLHT
jgi:hypothetical protein